MASATPHLYDAMDELEEELIALAEIYTSELKLVRDETEIRMTLPLRLNWQLVFVINAIKCQSYVASVLLIKPNYPSLDLHEAAANNAQLTAATFLNDRIMSEHKSLYAAYQYAIDAFDDSSFSKPIKKSEEYIWSDASMQKSNIARDRGAGTLAQDKNNGKTKADEKAASTSPDALETTIIILDHINDSKRYYRALSNFAHQLSISCIVFAKNPTNAAGDRIKHAIVIIQSQSKNSEFIRKLKTEYVDLNKAGKPCKERCSSTVLITWQYNYFEEGNIFKVIDCSTTDAIQIIQEEYIASEISNVVREFCLPKR